MLFLIARDLLENECHFILGIFKAASMKENEEFSRAEDNDTSLESLLAFLKLHSHNTYASSSSRSQKPFE